MMGDPIPVGEGSDGPVEQKDEAGTCPECGGRGNPCGSTASVQFYNCEYCENSFKEPRA